MGERATGGAWGARDEASWWPAGAGDLQHQEQLSEDVARSTAAATQQLYTYKITGGFPNNGEDNTTSNYDYRQMSSGAIREESPQQAWWYNSGSVESHQQNSSPTQDQSSPDPDQGNNQQSNGVHQQTQQQMQQNQPEQNQQLQIQQNQQNLQQQTQQSLQQQTQQSLQQMLQQQQNQQALQQTLQQTLSQAQAQAIVQAQQALQQQVAQTIQQQQQTLQEHIQAVQQQQIQAALQRQSANLQELQQQAQQQALLAQTTVTKGRMPRARADNKPRGRMTAYAFFVQTCREEHKKKHPDENVIFAAFSKKCAERWNTMSEKEKLRFHEMAEQDKRRYDLEMQSYVPPKGVQLGRGKKRKQTKDPNAPKRSLSAFFWFCNDERSKVKATNPEYTMGDIAKELGRRWASADPQAKSKFEALSEQDKARYDREMMAYKKGPVPAPVAHDEPEFDEEYE